MPSPSSLLAPDESALITALLAALRRELDAAACSVALADGDGLVFVAAVGAGADDVLGLHLPLGRGLAGFVAVSGQGLAVSDVDADHRFDRVAAESTGYVPRAITAVPILAGPRGAEDEDDDTSGVLEVLDPGRDDPAYVLERAAEVAAQVGLVRALGLALEAATRDGTDPELVELHALISRVGELDPERRRLAGRLLAAVLEP